MVKKVLITGGTGFIGTHLVDQCIQEKYEVYVFAIKNDIDGIKKLKKLGDVHIITEDIDELLSNVEHHPCFDTIYHLASYGVDYRQQDVVKMTEVNVLLTAKLLEFAKMNKTKLFVNVGTAFEYGLNEGSMLSETDPDYPQGLYAATKNAASKIGIAYCKIQDIPFTNVRLFGTFGPGEGLHKIVPMVMKAGITRSNLELTAGGQIRDYTYVKDIVFALMLIGDRKESVVNETFNICTGKAISIKELIEIIIETCEFDDKLFQFGALEYRKNEVMHFVGSNQKIKEILNWETRTSLKEAIQETYEYYRNMLEDN